MSLLFFSKIDSLFSVIGIVIVFTLQLSGSGRVEICISLPRFTEDELDIEVTDD